MVWLVSHYIDNDQIDQLYNQQIVESGGQSVTVSFHLCTLPTILPVLANKYYDLCYAIG